MLTEAKNNFFATRDGYDFNGWKATTGGSVITNASGVLNANWTNAGNSTLIADWTARRMTVTLNAGEGEFGSGTGTKTQTVYIQFDSRDVYDASTSGNKLTTFPTPVRADYDFVGYKTDSTRVVVSQGENWVLNDDWDVDYLNVNELTAEWSAHKYVITFNANEGTFSNTGVLTGDNTRYGQNLYVDQNFSLATASGYVSRDGYTLTGWKLGTTSTVYETDFVANANSAEIQAIKTAQTLTAVWEANDYTITYTASATATANGAKVPSPLDYNIETAVSLASAENVTAPTGYTFGGWKVLEVTFAAGESPTKTTGGWTIGTIYQGSQEAGLFGNVKMEAVFNPITYTIVFNGNGSTSGSTASVEVTYDDASVNLTKNGFARTGYTFAGWATSQGATTAQYTDGQSVTANQLEGFADSGNKITLYAVWNANIITVN